MKSLVLSRKIKSQPHLTGTQLTLTCTLKSQIRMMVAPTCCQCKNVATGGTGFTLTKSLKVDLNGLSVNNSKNINITVNVKNLLVATKTIRQEYVTLPRHVNKSSFKRIYNNRNPWLYLLQMQLQPVTYKIRLNQSKLRKKGKSNLACQVRLSKIDGLTKPKSCTYLSEYISSSNNI